MLVEVGNDRLEVVAADRRETFASQVRGGGLLFPVAPGKKFGRVRSLPEQNVRDVGDLFAQRLRVNTTFEVVGHLLLAATVGLVDGALHRVSEHVGVHVHLARHVAGRTTDGLDQGRRRA